MQWTSSSRERQASLPHRASLSHRYPGLDNEGALALGLGLPRGPESDPSKLSSLAQSHFISTALRKGILSPILKRRDGSSGSSSAPFQKGVWKQEDAEPNPNTWLPNLPPASDACPCCHLLAPTGTTGGLPAGSPSARSPAWWPHPRLPSPHAASPPCGVESSAHMEGSIG